MKRLRQVYYSYIRVYLPNDATGHVCIYLVKIWLLNSANNVDI